MRSAPTDQDAPDRPEDGTDGEEWVTSRTREERENMPIISTLAGEVRDINPDLATAGDVRDICRFAQARLNQMLTNGMPLSKQERETEEILEEIDTILETLKRDEIQNTWKAEGLAHAFLGRLSELEDRAYNIFLTSIEEVEEGNPLTSLAEEYREALALKAKGQVHGAIVVPWTPEVEE